LSAGCEREVVVIGAGPAGLATAAMLERRHIPTVILERGPRPGSKWHERHPGMQLNTSRRMSQLPKLGMERRHGRWPTAREWAAYLVQYATEMGLAVETDTEATRVERVGDGWRIETTAGSLDARAVVIATGHDHSPRVPEWPGRRSFGPKVMHSSEVRDERSLDGHDTLVVGSGTSGADIATALTAREHGKVWLSVRTPPLIMRRAYLGIPSTLLGLWAGRSPRAVIDRAGWLLHGALYRDLATYGLSPSPKRLSEGLDAYFSPLMDNGFADAVRRRQVEIVAAVERLDGDRVVLADGTLLEPSAVVAATGYLTDLEGLLGHLGVVAADGEPVSRGGQSPAGARNLYFAGFRFGLGALLPYISADANQIAKSVAGRSSRRRPRRLMVTRQPQERGMALVVTNP
jgi:putative flavoprotein involved in K+ transport